MSSATAHAETHSFQAETQRLLEIVIHSLYTDREVFIRELISNAADALEKRRHEALATGSAVEEGTLDIAISLDEAAGQFCIRDTGVGMTREELAQGLGTIAHSGTRKFLEAVAASGRKDVSLIGQFGVGFYSAFMVAKKVTVETRSASGDAQGWVWESEGTGQYTVSPREGLEIGTKVTLDLRDDAREFASASNVSGIIHRFSNFVAFPIRVGGEVINTVQAIWRKQRSEISDNDYNEFYRFLSGTQEEPLARMHFTAESPIDIHALLFVPKENVERLGFGKMPAGVDLYCRRVLIDKHPEELLPEWLRFLRGVIDSEDLPLNISRESMQDSTLLRRISKTITGRFLRFLEEMARDDAARYAEFHDQFGTFLREGISSDFAHRADLARLLRFESSRTEGDARTSLAEYVSRMAEGQEEIYFLNGPSRAAAEASPYMDAFRARGIEVLFTRDAGDDFTLSSLHEFEGKRLRSADSPDIKLPPVEAAGEELPREEAESLCGWLKGHLGERIGSVRLSSRLVGAPAMVVGDGYATNAMRRLMVAMGREEKLDTGRLTLELNPRHAFIRDLSALRYRDGEFARTLGEQLLDMSLLSAGLLQDATALTERMNAILARAAK